MSTFTVSDTRELLEIEPHRFVAEASTLQLPSWVAQILAPGIGNGQPLIRTRVERDADGDSLFAEYHQVMGCVTLKVFND